MYNLEASFLSITVIMARKSKDWHNDQGFRWDKSHLNIISFVDLIWIQNYESSKSLKIKIAVLIHLFIYFGFLGLSIWLEQRDNSR